jgi:pectate lyase
MRLRTLMIGAICLAVGATTALTWPANASSTNPTDAALAIARQPLPANDGWAAAGTGTTGGSTADDAHIFVVRNRAELVAALGGNNATNATNSTPKIVFIKGKLNAYLADDGTTLTCADFADPAYDLNAFLATYDPAVWGRVAPSGPLEDARVRSTKNQKAQVVINIGPNTTIVGLNDAVLKGFNLNVQNVDNVIIRNLNVQDAHDCFPAWSPTDGATGNWNSNYDTLSVTGGTHVWIDHDTFSDGNNLDQNEPIYFGRPWQVHDGSVDITKAADDVTVSYCDFYDHDKTMLIGSTNTVGADVGKLNVTLHHNRFANVGQRAPRVRFGHVDVYNNYYIATTEDFYQYSFGVGVYASIYAENNIVLRSADVPLDAVVFDWRGTAPGAMTELGSLVKVGSQPAQPVNFVASYNAVHDPDITTDAGWVPTLRAAPPDPTSDVAALVSKQAGSHRLGI